MVKRNKDGTLRQIAQLPKDNWLREGSRDFRKAVLDKQLELRRRLTEDEVSEIREQFEG